MSGRIESLQAGEHAILLYRSREEQFQCVVPYIRIGLARNERCLYIAADNPVRLVIDELERAGIDVVGAERRGQITFASPQETYLKGGEFDPERIVDGLQEEIARSLREGFSAFRGSGELGWAAAVPTALMRLYEYEAVVARRMSDHFLALCQYNENLFSPEFISKMLRVHPVVLARGSVMRNPHYVGPEKFQDDDLPCIAVADVAGAIGS